MQKIIEASLPTVSSLLKAKGFIQAEKILCESKIEIELTGYDNWNGGTDEWSVSLRIPAQTYIIVEKNKENLENQIKEYLEIVLKSYTNKWYSVQILPLIEDNPNWKENKKNVVQLMTRKNIIDGIRIESIFWSGALDEIEFLQRIYNLEKMPSTDSRFKDASRDIWQHRVNNPYDWSDDWIFSDSRFDLLNCSTDKFLQFLCEMVHPLVRPDREEQVCLAKQFNDQLKQDNWQLVEIEKIAGRPRFIAQEINSSIGRATLKAKYIADSLSAAWMHNEITRMENSIDSDPALAIGTAKDFVETCCKTILTELKIVVPKNADIPALTKLLTQNLGLVPDGITDEKKGAISIRQTLHSLSAIPRSIAELRGLYGSGHGRDGKHRGLGPRHAKLAVSSAIAFVEFVTETYQERK